MAEIVREQEKQKPTKKLNFWPRTVARLVLAASAASLALSGGIKAANQEVGGNSQNIPIPTPEAHKSPEPTGTPQVVLTSEPATSTETPSPFETAIPSPHSDFEQVRTLIENAQGSQEEKTQAIQSVENLEKVQGVLNQFETSYEAQTEPDGTPTLLAQERASFGNLDLRPLWEGKFVSEKDFLESQIFFLSDQKSLNYALDQTIQAHGLNTAEIKTQLESSLNFKVPYNIYLEAGTQKESGYEIIPPAGMENDPRIIAATVDYKEILDKTPHVGHLIVKIDPNIGGGNFDGFGENPEITIGIGPKTFLIHEIGHGLDPDKDLIQFIKQFSPEELIALMKEKNKATESDWSKNYYSYTDMYPDNYFSIPPGAEHLLTPSEFALISASNTERIWVGEKTGFGTESPFKQFLTSPTLDEHINSLDQPRYKTFDEFFEKESQNLDSISQENKNLGYTIKVIRENPQVFDRYFGKADDPEWLGRDSQVYYGAVRMFSTLILSEGLFENRQEVKNLFTGKELAEIDQKILLLKPVTDGEQWADSIQVSRTFLTVDGNLFEDYLKMITDFERN
jgi:hypothetical protein